MSTCACFMTGAIWSLVTGDAVVRVELGDQRAVGGQHLAVARRQSGRQLVGQAVDQVGGVRGRPGRRRRRTGNSSPATSAPARTIVAGELRRASSALTREFSDIAGQGTCYGRCPPPPVSRGARAAPGSGACRSACRRPGRSAPRPSPAARRGRGRRRPRPGTVRTATCGWALVNRSASRCSRVASVIRSACTRSAPAASLAPLPPDSATASAAASARVADSAVVAGGWVRLSTSPASGMPSAESRSTK